MSKDYCVTQKLCVVMVIMMIISLIDARPKEPRSCRPLPKCCRKYVHAAVCRGVTAKRNSYPLTRSESRFPFEPEDVTVSNKHPIEPSEEFDNEELFRSSPEDIIDY